MNSPRLGNTLVCGEGSRARHGWTSIDGLDQRKKRWGPRIGSGPARLGSMEGRGGLDPKVRGSVVWIRLGPRRKDKQGEGLVCEGSAKGRARKEVLEGNKRS